MCASLQKQSHCFEGLYSALIIIRGCEERFIEKIVNIVEGN